MDLENDLTRTYDSKESNERDSYTRPKLDYLDVGGYLGLKGPRIRVRVLYYFISSDLQLPESQSTTLLVVEGPSSPPFLRSFLTVFPRNGVPLSRLHVPHLFPTLPSGDHL